MLGSGMHVRQHPQCSLLGALLLPSSLLPIARDPKQSCTKLEMHTMQEKFEQVFLPGAGVIPKDERDCPTLFPRHAGTENFGSGFVPSHPLGFIFGCECWSGDTRGITNSGPEVTLGSVSYRRSSIRPQPESRPSSRGRPRSRLRTVTAPRRSVWLARHRAPLLPLTGVKRHNGSSPKEPHITQHSVVLMLKERPHITQPIANWSFHLGSQSMACGQWCDTRGIANDNPEVT